MTKLQARLEELRLKKASGTLTPAEQHQLTRLEALLGQSGAGPSTPRGRCQRPARRIPILKSIQGTPKS